VREQNGIPHKETKQSQFVKDNGPPLY